MSNFSIYELSQRVDFHTTGTIKRGRQKVAVYYMADKVSHDARKWLESRPHIKVVGTQSQYAPELKRCAIIMLSDAERKRIKAHGIADKDHVQWVIGSLPHL